MFRTWYFYAIAFVVAEFPSLILCCLCLIGVVIASFSLFLFPACFEHLRRFRRHCNLPNSNLCVLYEAKKKNYFLFRGTGGGCRDRGKKLPESCRSLSGLFAMTDVLFDGIGSDGLGLFCMAARACCTASCLTSVIF